MLNDSKNIIRAAVYLIVFYFGVKYALPLTAPFLIGLGIAAAVQKPANLLSSRIPRLNRKTCCIILTSAVIFAGTSILYLSLCAAVNGAISVCPGIPEQLSRLRQLVASASSETQDADSWKKFTAFVASGADWCLNLLTENYRQYLPSVLARSTKLISGLPSLLTSALFALLSAFFGCGDFDKVKAAVKQWLPEQSVRRISTVIEVSADTVAALIKTYGTIMLITFAELTAGLGIMSLAGHRTGNIVSIEIVRNFVEPKLISVKLELHPVFTLAGVYVGGKLFGITGIFAMPLAMMIFRRLRTQKTDEAI